MNAIVDADAAERAGWNVLDLAAAFLDAGATFVQLRAKQAASGWLLETAEAIVTMAARTNALVVVNDRADVAKLANAAGVHIGQDDLNVRSARTIVGPGRIVGFSTHSIEQLDAAVGEPLDYVAIGPVFGTASKETGYNAVGLDMVREAASRAHARGLPVVAIGGVTLERVAEVIAAGADAVAVISDLLVGDPRTRVREYLDQLASVRRV